MNGSISSSINVFASFASMFATRFVAFRFIVSNSIPDLKLSKVGRLYGSVYRKLNKDTSNLSIIFLNVVIRFSALDEMIDFRTEFSDKANIFGLAVWGYGKVVCVCQSV